MNFTAYIERQKNLIRCRHEGETYVVVSGEVIPVYGNEKLFVELTKSKGLNTRERLAFGRAV